MSMITLIEKELGKKALIDFQPMQPGDVKESFADIKYSFQKLGYKPEINIHEGIPLVISWYNEFNGKN